MVNEYRRNGTIQRIVLQMNENLKMQLKFLEKRLSVLCTGDQQELSEQIRENLNCELSIVSFVFLNGSTTSFFSSERC